MSINRLKQWAAMNKLGLVLGFIFGAIIAPSLAIMGLVSPFLETARPLLIGPMDMIGSLIPDVQTAPDTYYVPAYKWVITLGFNGICYAALGGIIQHIRRKLKTRNQRVILKKPKKY